MFETNLKIIQDLKDFIKIIHNDSLLLEKVSTVPNAFTRTRKLPFDRLVLLISKLCKKTLSVEIEQFFEDMNLPVACSVSAFTQQRMKLNPVFYTLWNYLLCHSYYHHYGQQVKRWRGYRIIAADGSNLSLVNTPELEKYFGGQTNQHGAFIQAKAFYCYDVLNKLILHSQIAPYRTGEMKLAHHAITNLKDDMLVIYDRNFSNYKMIALHQWQEKEIKFIIRGNENQNIIKDFIRSNTPDEVIYLKPTTTMIKGLYESGYKISENTKIKVRLVRVELEKSVEVLMTNLWEEDGYLNKEFKNLYFKRWGVETNISLQKNIIQLESFSGLTPRTVEQDFYATTFITNLFSLLVKQAQRLVDKTNKKRKYPGKVNGNKAYGKFKTVLIQLFVTKSPEIIIKIVQQYFIRNPLPIRKNRTFQRIIKNKQSRSKHKTFTNYKPAF